MSDVVKIGIEITDQAAQNALAALVKIGGSADKQLKGVGDSGESAFKRISVGLSKTIGLQEIFVGNLAANVAQKAFESIKGSIGLIINEAALSEQAIQNLNVALKSAGQFTPKASQGFQDLAAAIQKTTIYSDEAVLSSASLLLNLTALSKDGIERATLAAVDLAATVGVDLDKATDIINKGISGSNKGFKQFGIEVASANTEAERLENILIALAGQQGNAAKQALTYAGAQKKATNQQSELFEAIGKVLTQSDAAASKTLLLSKIYEDSAKFITENTEAIRDFGTALKITAEIALVGAIGYGIASAALGILSIAAYTGATAFGVLSTAASAAWAAIVTPITIVVAAVAAVVGVTYLLVRNWDAIKAATYDAIAASLEFASVAASVVSSGLAESLSVQANAYRDQASAIRSSTEEALKKAKFDKENDEKEKAQAKILADRMKKEQEDSQRHSVFITSNAKRNQEQLILIEQEKNLRLAEISASFQEQKVLKDAEYSTADLVAYNTNAELRLLAQQDIDKRELELQLKKQLDSANAENEEGKRKELIAEAAQKAKIARQQLFAKQELDVEKLKNDNKKKLDDDALKARDGTLKLFASMSQSNNSILATIGKASALTQIAIATPVAVAEATKFGMATGGPPLAATFAAIAYAAMAAQAAQVVGLQFANGGIVPGNSFSGDKINAGVNSGEMVLNKVQQTNLFEIANGKDRQMSRNADSFVMQQISNLTKRIDSILSQPISVQVDGSELFNITRNQLASGRSY